MPFESQTYRVLIASPSDLPDERQAATDAINEWNAQHAAAESVVLLPVTWQTHALPTTGIRPQEAINRQLVRTADLLIGMFWTKFGTSTGVAESGTVEEIDQFVARRKPAMLYFSTRPVSPNSIDLKQLENLREFKNETYKKALAGSFASVEELRQTLARDLMNQVRALKAKQRRKSSDKIDDAARLTELIRAHKEHNISPEEFRAYREIVGLQRRTKPAPVDPLQPGEVGPNGYRVGYTKDGDKVEWLPTDDPDDPDEEWPIILRRGDKAILAAHNEFWDKVWWNRKQVWIEQLEESESPLSEDTKAKIAEIKRLCRRVERKYGKRNLGWDDFEWGLLSGKLSALAWVLGSEWVGSLDT